MLDASRLRKARQHLQLSQQRLGELIGQDQQYVSKLERGILPGMTIDTLERLADALGVSTDYLLNRTDAPTPLKRARRKRLAAAEEEEHEQSVGADTGGQT